MVYRICFRIHFSDLPYMNFLTVAEKVQVVGGGGGGGGDMFV
jgi:hypothetical protein